MSAASHAPQRSNRTPAHIRTRSRAALFTGGAVVAALVLSACGSGGKSGGSGNTGFVTGSDGIATVTKGERTPAPDLSGKTIDGKQLDVADYKGKVVVLNVWASWCDPCREEVPLLQKTHEQIEAKGGVVLGLDTQDASNKAIEFLKERKATFPSLRDRDRSYGREFGVTGYPETFLIDRKGRIAALQRFPVTQEWLDQHLPKLLAERA
jgi:cytochrome c biogenesis protein CcmG, thiol:disulfide interchange protein DsbE